MHNVAQNCTHGIGHELERNMFQNRHNCLQYSDSLRRIGMEKQADRVRGCGAFLNYKIFHNDLNSNGYQKLVAGFFCSNVLCPICNKRKAMKRRNQILAIMEHISEYRFISITLTMKNMGANELENAVDKMLRSAWNYLSTTRRFKSAIHGYARSFEIVYDSNEVVTKNMYFDRKRYYDKIGLKPNDPNPNYGKYHPHLHILAAVESSYLEKDSPTYIHHSEWVAMWAKALKIDYSPIVHVQVIYDEHSKGKRKNEVTTIKAILESAKYVVKSSSDFLIRDKFGAIDTKKTDEVVYTLSKCLFNRRLNSMGGIFRKIVKQLDLDSVDDGDLVHIEAEVNSSIDDDYILYSCTWGRGGYKVMPIQIPYSKDDIVVSDIKNEIYRDFESNMSNCNSRQPDKK